MIGLRYKVSKRVLAFLTVLCILLSSCGKKTESGAESSQTVSDTGAPESTSGTENESGTDNSLLPGGNTSSTGVTIDYSVPNQMSILNKDLVPGNSYECYGSCYEIFVYSFYDSDGDGIGDLNGVTEKLDYINDGDDEADSDLGMNMIWLMPVFESPSYHKYDVTDYMTINKEYGSMEDFETLLTEAHKRGISVIIDMPINHTSSEHPWFTTAVEYIKSLAPGEEIDYDACPYAGYYNFSKDSASGYEKLTDDWYYEARFYSGMPDLNLDSEAVRSELKSVLEFWLDKGVDGYRFDAVTYFYTGANEKNTEFLKWVNDVVQMKKPGAYTVCEAWTDSSVYASYYASGVDSMFDFDYAGAEGRIASLIKGSLTAKKFALGLEEEENLYLSYNENFINAPFYTNHDFARSAGYYAGDDGSLTKLGWGLNFIMGGNAFLYYGEELGMKGSGKDENKRAPMYWTGDADAAGMCVGPVDMDSFDMKFPALDEQAEDEYSIYNYVKNAIRIRNAFPVIARGKTWVADTMCDDDLIVLEKGGSGAPPYEPLEDPVLVVVNVSGEDKELKLQGRFDNIYDNLAAVLTVGSDYVELSEGTVYLPPYAIAVITQSE